MKKANQNIQNLKTADVNKLSQSKQSNMQNWNIADVKMKRQRKQIQIYTTEMHQMSLYKHKESYVSLQN